MSNRLIWYLAVLLILPSLAFAGAAVPKNLTLSATENTIDADWTGDADDDGYYVYWGTDSGDLKNRATMDDSATAYTITGLEAGTTYYVAVSAYDNYQGETERSDIASITTTSDTVAPAAPTGFDVTSLDDITETSVSFKWNINTEADIDHYNVYYGTASGSYDAHSEATDADAASFTVTGLNASKRYYFTITAVDTFGNESDTAPERAVDTLEDNLPPNPPDGISAALSGSGEITVKIQNGNETLADYSGNIIYYGTASGVYEFSEDIGEALSYVLGGLTEGETWYFAAASYDHHGNTSEKSREASAEVSATRSFLNKSDDVDGGCFIGSCQGPAVSQGLLLMLALFLVPAGLALFKGRRFFMLLIPVFLFLFCGDANAGESTNFGNNTAGVSVGYYYSLESDFDDYYDEGAWPIFAFYERRIFRFFSLELEAGYFSENGHVLTVSGQETEIDSDLTVAPVSASLKMEIELMPYISGYIGVGPDYWYCREETDIPGLDTDREWIGGYHGKLGVRLYNMDEAYRGTGVLMEVAYAEVDRFGGNDTDIGGLMFKAGIFYQF